MAGKRQKRRAARKFQGRKKSFSAAGKDGAGHDGGERGQPDAFLPEHTSAQEQPAGTLPGNAGRISGHNVRKPETDTDAVPENVFTQNQKSFEGRKKKEKKKSLQNGTSGHNVQKQESGRENTFLEENGFAVVPDVKMEEEQQQDTQYLPEKVFEDDVHGNGAVHRTEEKRRHRKRRVQKGYRKKDRGRGRREVYGEYRTGDAAFSETENDFTADKKVRKAADKSEKAGEKLRKARDRLPTKTEYSMERVFDEKTGKAKYVIVPVKKEKPFQPDGIGKMTVRKLRAESAGFIHSKIAENEGENSAVEGAHKTEQGAEDAFRFVRRHTKSREQRQRDRITRLEKKKFRADVDFEYRKFLSENPEMEKKSLHKQIQKRMQKRRIRREYAKAGKTGRSAGTARKAFSKSADTAAGAAKKLQEMASRNKALLIPMGGAALLLVFIMSMFSSCGSMFTESISTTLMTTYLSSPAEIDAADLSMTQKELELQNTVDGMEASHPGYDEYEYDLGEIGHNPFTLISYLSAVYTEITAAGVETEIQGLFDEMYSLATEEVEETRTRTVTRTGTRPVTDADGNPVLAEDGSVVTEEYSYEAEEEYTAKILHVTLAVTPLETVIAGKMNTEQAEIYAAYSESKGGLQQFTSPVDYYWYDYVDSYYGYRKNPYTGTGELHRGLDISVPAGTEVYAAHDGTVTEAQYHSYYGYYVSITDSRGCTTKYAHMGDLNVGAGQEITKGTVIGHSGNSLHMECMYNGEYYNPLFYFYAGTRTLYG